MTTYTIWQVAETVGATKMQIEKWISRGLFEPSQSVPEKRAREYVLDDVVHLAAIVSLQKFGMSVKQAASIADAAMKSADPMAHVLKGVIGVYVNIENIRKVTKASLKRGVGQNA